MLFVSDYLIFLQVSQFLSLVTGLSYVLIFVLLQELLVFSVQIASLLCVVGLLL